ncbi:MAG: hypothetical protein HFG41_05365 [Coprococcus sp.]|nr:hypothetical protein [Coprococcus sp.]
MPRTLKQTNLQGRKVGEFVNLENDNIIGKYVVGGTDNVSFD